MKDSIRSWSCAALASLMLLAPVAARATLASAASEAATWLELVQNADGSWGPSPHVKPLYTSEAVLALRAYGRRGHAYQRGVAWLESRAMTSVDSRARRIVALVPHGDDVSRDQNRLAASFSSDGFYGNGWGLGGPHVAAPLDTGLALQAIGALGVPPALLSSAAAGVNFLIASQVAGAGWKGALAAANAASDPVTTAVVLRGYAAVRGPIGNHASSGNTAQSYLLATVVSGSVALHKAQAALAVLRWTPGTASADSWLNQLDTTQGVNGSWGQDPYATAVALHALAARLGTDSAALQQVVVIQDLGLRAAINLALGKNRVDAITRREMQSLTTLQANGFGIQSLAGIQEAINLTTINLNGNSIADLTPLNALPNLTTVVLAGLCDLDADGRISLRDAQRTLRAAALRTTLSPSELTVADVHPISTPDGVVSLADAAAVLRAAAGWSVPACQD
jgi:hypothetical protein